MHLRWLLPAAAAGALVWYAGHRSPAAQGRTALGAPAVVLMEGAPEGGSTDVVVREAGSSGRIWLGRVEHAPGSARRGTLLVRGGEVSALLVVAEHESRGASTYNSALFLVGGGVSRRLLGGLTDASTPLVTERGTVLVQRGRDGAEPELDETAPRVLRERVDALSIDAVDPSTGQARTLWTGSGQIAFLATALRGDEALVYHVTPEGAWLFVLDASGGGTRPLAGPFPALARDFSYDRTRDEVLYVRAAAPGSQDYEVVALPLRVGSERVVFRGASDRLMPRALAGGALAFSLPSGAGLALMADTLGAPVRRTAPLGAGTDAVLGESDDGRWLAVRHSEPGRQYLALIERAGGRSARIERAQSLTEFVGFVPAGARVSGGWQ